jgi:uncharacterized protein (TIGR04255 family)
MSEAETQNNQLNRNAVTQFFLRVDVGLEPAIDYERLVSDLSKDYDRIEKRQVANLSVIFTDGKSQMTTNDSFDFVLASESTGLTLTISEIQKAIILETKHYLNNSVYKSSLENIVRMVRLQSKDVLSRRIGLRYVNQFPAQTKARISKIFEREYSNVITNMLASDTFISRAIAMNEYNYSQFKARVQYGLPNKFYPGILATYDLLLDIDCFDDGAVRVGDWPDAASKLNHGAYAFFAKFVSDAFLAELR